jgi:hypothetical protein
LCEGAPTKKAKAACKREATRTIKEIVAYIKERKSDTKDASKEIKESLKHFKRTLKEKTDKINEKVRSHRGTRKVNKGSSDEEMHGGAMSKKPIENIDTDYERYKQSAFNSIKSKCRIPAKRTVFESYPTIMELRADIRGLRDAAKIKDKDAKLFAKNIRVQLKTVQDAIQKNDLKMQIKTMAIEKKMEIARINEKIAKKEKFTRKLKHTLERKYKKSLKDRAKAEKDILEVDEETGELKKKVKEFHDLADIEDVELRGFVKMKTQEFVDELRKIE